MRGPALKPERTDSRIVKASSGPGAAAPERPTPNDVRNTAAIVCCSNEELGSDQAGTAGAPPVMRKVTGPRLCAAGGPCSIVRALPRIKGQDRPVRLKAAVLDAMEGRVLAEGRLTGTHSRQ